MPQFISGYFLAFLALSFFLVSTSLAQQDGLLLPNDDVQRFLKYQQTRGLLPDAHLTHQPLSAYEAQTYLDSLHISRNALSATDRQLLDRYRGIADGPGVQTAQRIYGRLYEDGRHLFSVEGDDYRLQLRPLLYMYYGQGRQTATDDRNSSVPFWRNTRGARISGKVGPIFFDSRLEENQRRDIWPHGSPFLDDFDHNWRTAPRLNSTKFDPNGNVFDYFAATGTIGFRSPHFEVRLGRDKNFWGPGQNSLFLSDYADVYDQLQIRTSFWRLQYTNLWAQMYDPSGYAARFVPHKFGIFHRLAVDLPYDVELEFFESVISHPDTTGGGRTRGDFDLQYLNPLIFYRSLEHDRGSPDNMTLGTGISWGIMDGIRLYSQFAITELVVDAIGSGSWLNKWGWLAGAHVAGIPLDGLSLRLEYSRIRPYVYMHRSPRTAYTHYGDIIGHPAGPNAYDYTVKLDYQVTSRIRASAQMGFVQRGRDPEGENFGNDLFKSYDDRTSDDAPMMIGIRQDQMLIEAYAGYELLPELFLEAALRSESFVDAELGKQRYAVPYLSLRWGLPYASRKY